MQTKDVSQYCSTRKPVLTPARRALTAPSRRLAQAIASEWDAQTDMIDPARMPLTRLANAVIDAVVDRPQPVADEIAQIHWIRFTLLSRRCAGRARRKAIASLGPGARLGRAKSMVRALCWREGVVHTPQPHDAVAAMTRNDPGRPVAAHGRLIDHDADRICAPGAGALHKTQLQCRCGPSAAHVDEDWQMSQWGRDQLALERRAFRAAEFQAAVTVLKLTA